MTDAWPSESRMVTPPSLASTLGWAALFILVPLLALLLVVPRVRRGAGYHLRTLAAQISTWRRERPRPAMRATFADQLLYTLVGLFWLVVCILAPPLLLGLWFAPRWHRRRMRQRLDRGVMVGDVLMFLAMTPASQRRYARRLKQLADSKRSTRR